MKHSFLQRRADGTLWHAGRSPWGLCAAYNHATDPALHMTQHQHHRSWQYARAIRNRISRLGLRYIEGSNGQLWPLK
jgi:hypothetical protein